MFRHALRLCILGLLMTPLSAAHAIVGEYKVTGIGSSDERSYNAEARIDKTGDTFSILFKSGDVGYVGTGIVVGNTLSVVFQPLVANSRPSVACYRIVNDVVVGGTWTILGSKTVGQERWTMSGA